MRSHMAIDQITPELLTLEELTNRVGMSVRNVRFYTTKGLVPPPDPTRPVRLLLPRPRGPPGAGAGAAEPRLHAVGDRAVRRGHPRRRHPRGHRAAPHHARAVAGRPAGRDVPRGPGEAGRPPAHPQGHRHACRARHRLRHRRRPLPRGGLPARPSASACSISASRSRPPRAAAEVYTKHGQEIAHELYDVFRRLVWPVYQESGASPETIQGAVERLKPLSIASLVSAYEAGMDQTRRENIAARAKG